MNSLPEPSASTFPSRSLIHFSPSRYSLPLAARASPQLNDKLSAIAPPSVAPTMHSSIWRVFLQPFQLQHAISQPPATLSRRASISTTSSLVTTTTLPSTELRLYTQPKDERPVKDCEQYVCIQPVASKKRKAQESVCFHAMTGDSSVLRRPPGI